MPLAADVDVKIQELVNAATVMPAVVGKYGAPVIVADSFVTVIVVTIVSVRLANFVILLLWLKYFEVP